MAHHKSALKRIRTSEKRRLRNRGYRKMMRKSLRAAREAEGDQVMPEVLKACQVLDKLVSKGIIHKKTAARRKSRLYKSKKSATATA